MTLKEETKKALEKYNLQPKKYFGQNFLIEKGTLKNIMEAADLETNDTVLEIGSGLGVLTKALAKKTKKVIAVEKDKELTKILQEEIKENKIQNVKAMNTDMLKIKINNLKLKNNYKVVANLPYYITSPVIRKLLEEKNPPRLIVLMVQKEVAKRICQKPPKMTILSVAVQFYANPEIIKIVNKESFWPKPKVDSAIIKIQPRKNIEKKQISPDAFFKIVKAGFSSPRKQLKNNLKSVFGSKTEEVLQKSDINEKRRAESLSIAEWKKIINASSYCQKK